MPTDLENRMLTVLATRRSDDHITIADFARMFGAPRALVASCTERMVHSGTAVGRYIDQRGTRTLHGLSRQPVAEPTT